jgi:hypothetical protein
MFIATSNFLIPNATLIVELVAFLVVLAFIGKYVLPYLKKALDERAALIGSQLAAADEAKATPPRPTRTAGPRSKKRARRRGRSWPRPTARPSRCGPTARPTRGTTTSALWAAPRPR